MGSLFKQPQPPQEDPAIGQMRAREAARAEAERIKATQQQLGQETLLYNRGRGIASLAPLTSRRQLTSLIGSG